MVEAIASFAHLREEASDEDPVVSDAAQAALTEVFRGLVESTGSLSTNAYLGREHFDAFAITKNPDNRQPRVIAGRLYNMLVTPHVSAKDPGRELARRLLFGLTAEEIIERLNVVNRPETPLGPYPDEPPKLVKYAPSYTNAVQFAIGSVDYFNLVQFGLEKESTISIRDYTKLEALAISFANHIEAG